MDPKVITFYLNISNTNIKTKQNKHGFTGSMVNIDTIISCANSGIVKGRRKEKTIYSSNES